MRIGMWFSAAVCGGTLLLGSWLILFGHSRDSLQRKPSTVANVPARDLAPRELTQLAAAASPAPAPTRAGPAVSPSPPVAGEAAPAEPMPTREQRVFELQQKYEAAAAPDSRALSVEKALSQELQGALSSDSHLQSVDCKATICRAVLGFPSLEADRSAFGKLLQRMEGPVAELGLSVSRETSPSGVVTATVFMNLK